MRIDADSHLAHLALRFTVPSLLEIHAHAVGHEHDHEHSVHRPEPIDHAERDEPLHDDGPIPFAKYLKRINRETPRLIHQPPQGAPLLETAASHSNQAAPTVHNVVLKKTPSTPPAPFERVYVPVPIPVTGRLIDVLA